MMFSSSPQYDAHIWQRTDNTLYVCKYMSHHQACIKSARDLDLFTNPWAYTASTCISNDAEFVCVCVCVFVCAPRRYMWGRKQCVQSMVFISTVPTTQGWKLIIPLEWVHTARQSCSRLLMVRGVCWNWLSFQSMTDGLFVCLTFDSALSAVLISLYIFTQGIFLSASFFVKQVSWCNFIWPM